MTISEFAQVLTALAALGALFVASFNALQIHGVHKSTNSMKDKLVVAVRKAAHALGLKEGLARNKANARHRARTKKRT